jgi:predicted RNA-binding protein with PUA-like domain
MTMPGTWLLKSEPQTFSWQDLLRDGHAVWDGVRNHQARNHLAAMQVADRALFYHSGTRREVVAEMEIARAAFADPTSQDPRWLAVEVRPLRELPRAVSLAAIKSDPLLANILLVRNSRLSVLPLGAAEYRRILELAGAL